MVAYIKLDDRFPDHPKVVAAGPDAAYLYVCGLCYCNRYLTDGFIPSEIVPRLTPFSEGKSQQLASTLVSVCLWHVSSKNGFDVHDYLDYQSSKDGVLAIRAVRSASGRLGGLAKDKQIAKQNSSKSLAKEEGRRKKEEVRTPLSLTEEFRQQMIERFGNTLSPDGVNEAIDDALSHKAVNKWKNTERYVQNWLRKEAERHGNTQRHPAPTRPNTQAPEVPGPFAKYR